MSDQGRESLLSARCDEALIREWVEQRWAKRPFAFGAEKGASVVLAALDRLAAGARLGDDARRWMNHSAFQDARGTNAEGESDYLREALARATHLGLGLLAMVDRETWRASGGDDGQGHYEGDYHAERIETEIRELARLAVGPQPRAEAETALTTAEDGTLQSPGLHLGAAATAENVAPKRPPSEPEQKPAHEKKAANVAAPSSEAVGHVGSTPGSAPEGGELLYTQADLDFFADNADEYFAKAMALEHTPSPTCDCERCKLVKQTLGTFS